MGDTPSWDGGGRLGPYQHGRRYRGRGTSENLGRIYEAHNVETGAAALVLMPGRVDDWRPRGGWSVRATSGEAPPFLALEVEHAPHGDAAALQELTLMLQRLTSALARVEDREEARTHLTREPGAHPAWRTVSRRRRLLAGVGACVAVALVVAAVALWPSPPVSGETKPGVAGAASQEEVTFANGQESELAAIAYPLPEKPFKQQKKPPCLQGREEEIRGGCWVQLKQDAPCARGTAEYEGKCYMPVGANPPEPRSLQP